MNSILSVIVLIALTFLTLNSVQADNDTDRVIGYDDFIAVNADATNIPFKYRSLVDAFGNMELGCTVTHIGGGYVLTAGHCVYAGPKPTQDRPCDGADFNIRWSDRIGRENQMISKCEKIIISQDTEGHDYALLKVSPVPKDYIQVDLSARSYVGEAVTIFSHPNALPLHWSKSCRVQRVYSTGLPNEAIVHRCDTNPGSSGATLIDMSTLKIIGIHNGGYSENITDASGQKFGVGYNYATSVFVPELYEAITKLNLY